MARTLFGRTLRRHIGDRVPPDLFVKCPNRACGELLYQKDLEKDLKVCKKCGYHFRLTAHERIATLLDPDSFEAFDFGLMAGDPLGFPGYPQKLQRYRDQTGLTDAVVAGLGAVKGVRTAICITDYHFIVGTMNSVVGETIARTLDRAADDGLPAILVSGTGGGARMEESLLSLMQMAVTAAALERFDRAGHLSICILTDSTMAGVYASWASLGDVILAEPGAIIGFTGERVAAKVQTEREPENFRTAEFNFEHGMIDIVTPRSQLRDIVGGLLTLDAARMGGGKR